MFYISPINTIQSRKCQVVLVEKSQDQSSDAHFVVEHTNTHKYTKIQQND